jgi:hypothetical protein
VGTSRGPGRHTGPLTHRSPAESRAGAAEPSFRVAADCAVLQLQSCSGGRLRLLQRTAAVALGMGGKVIFMRAPVYIFH